MDDLLTTCDNPSCGGPLSEEPFKARFSSLMFCSPKCRHNDGCRRRQAARRAADPEGVREYERWHKVRAKYGITKDDFTRLWDEQGGECAICRVDLATVKCCIDHDHQTSEVRGLLCNVCNQGIGYFGDDPERLSVAAAYLRSRGRRGVTLSGD